MNYTLINDFGNYNDTVAAYFDVLVNNSLTHFHEQDSNGQLRDKKHDSEALSGCIQNFEEYLHYNYQKSPETFNSVLNSIINNVRIISVLPKDNRGIYGETQTQKKMISINPDLGDSRNLTGEERIRLYMAHELGHVVNDEWMKRVEQYANQQIRSGSLTQDQAQLLYEGFSMLDEAIAQNRAENFVYDFSGKQRPGLTYLNNRNLYSGEPYRSNFDFYGELQEPSTLFARTLRGIGKENDDVRALDMLSDRAMSPDFFNSILNEYSKDGQMPAFTQELQYMGLLKRASYANFGHADIVYLRNSKINLDKFRQLAEKMRDYREPFVDDGGR